MALHKRTDIDQVLEDIGRGEIKKIYLCFGERFLCQQALQQIEQKLLATQAGTVHGIDGATEDNATILARILSFSLLPGLQIYRVTDSRLFLSRDIGASTWDKALKAHRNGKTKGALRHLAQLLNIGSITPEGTHVFSEIGPDQWQKLFGFSRPDQDLAWADQLIQESAVAQAGPAEDSVERLIGAIESGFPQQNVLLVSAENVDKRKKIFTSIKKHGDIIDCSVAEGASRAALNEQRTVIREMAGRTLKSFAKKMEPKILEQLFERVGFHPVAVVNEVEKLCLFVEDRQQISSQDLDLMVGRTREDAIFELTEAFGRKDSSRTMVILNHLLEDGIHELAIIASMRNFLRRLLIFRSLQAMTTPVWHNGMNANDFQNNYLPSLKEAGEWPDLLKGHPYALYMSFTKAAEFTPAVLKQSLALLLKAEFRLKSTGLPPRVVVEELLFTLIAITRPVHGRKTTAL
jgi:DNA polymerase-3 subunit delta